MGLDTMDRRDFIRWMSAAPMLAVAGKAAADPVHNRFFQLEVIVSSLEEARAAWEGGATRFEVAVQLEKGGLTPPVELVREIVEKVPVPARIMLREHSGFALTGSQELQTLIRKARAIAKFPVNGLVFGWVKDGQIDMDPMRSIIDAVPGTHFTVHNAIEMTEDPIRTLQTLKSLPAVDLALVCACKGLKRRMPGTLDKKIERLKHYKSVWENGKRHLLVNGLLVKQVGEVWCATGIREFHFGNQMKTPEAFYPVGKVDPQKVREVLKILNQARSCNRP